jgi:hypothetical protein
LRQLEEGDQPPPSEPPPQPAAPETPAALLALRDSEREHLRQQDRDIRLLIGSNKALRRELQGLRVRRWRDEEAIEALEAELGQARRGRTAAIGRSRQLARELEGLRSRERSRYATGSGGRPRVAAAGDDWRRVFAGDEPFFQRGFLLSDAATIAGTTVKRRRNAPSGTLIFGPYINLAGGSYTATIEARLYRPMPPLASFRADIVCDGAQQTAGSARFMLRALAGWRRCELVFTVLDGEDYGDFEIRVWARNGTPLEVRRIDLYQLSTEPPAAQDAASAA